MAYTATLKKLAENLKTTYENTIFNHPGNVGDTREKEVIDYLRKVMPLKYGFQSGEIFDESDVNSGQVDVIMYDYLFSTIFSDGTGKIVAPIESTYGIISVKSKMGIKELDNAIAGIKKYNSLSRPSSQENTLQIMPDFGITLGNGLSVAGNTFGQENISCIFAFDTTVALEKIIKKMMDSGCVDLVVIPYKFYIIGRERKEFGLKAEDGSKLEYVAIKTENSIALFILFLQIFLSRNRLISRDVSGLVLDIIHVSMLTKMVNGQRV